MDEINFAKIYSASKLKLFDQCPKAYHFTYLDEVYSKMKTELRRDPSNIWSFQTLGKAVHDAITLFFYLPKSEQAVENLKQQLKLTWRSEVMPQKLPPLGKWGGFKTLQEERKSYQEGLEMLLNFLKTFDQDLTIKYLPTKDLRNSIEDYKKLIKPIDNGLYVSGKFDLILQLADDDLEVVDFKTSKSESYDDFQLKFYKLLAVLNFQKPVNKANLYFLSTGKIKEFDLKMEKVSKIEKQVVTKIEKINKTTEFKPCPSKLCQYCLFRNFCPAKKEIAEFIAKPLSQDFIDDLPF